VKAFALRVRRALVQAAQWERSNPARSAAVRGREFGVRGDPEDKRRSLLLAGGRAGAAAAWGAKSLHVAHRRVLEQLLQRFLLERDFARLAEVALVLLSSLRPGELDDVKAGGTYHVYSLYPAACCGLEAVLRAHPGAVHQRGSGGGGPLRRDFAAFLLRARNRIHSAVKQFHPAAHAGEYGESLGLRAALVQSGHTEEYVVPRRAFTLWRGKMDTELHHTRSERVYIALIAHRRLLDAVREAWRNDPAAPPEPPDVLRDLDNPHWGVRLCPQVLRHRVSGEGWEDLTRKSLAWGGWWLAQASRDARLAGHFEKAWSALQHALELDLPHGNGVLLRLLQLYVLAGRVFPAGQLLEELAQGRRGPLSLAALGTVCAWQSSCSGCVEDGSLRKLQAIDPAHPGVLSILLGAIPPRTATDVRNLVEGLFLVLDGNPLHFEAWQHLALVVSAVDKSSKDKIVHFVQTPEHEPRRVRPSKLTTLRVVPETLHAEALQALVESFAPRRDWWRRFHLRPEAIFSHPVAPLLDSATQHPAARLYSGSWLRCMNFFESKKLRGAWKDSRDRLGEPANQPPNMGAYADAWSASATFPFQPPARTLPDQELHLQCFWGKELGPGKGLGKKPAILLRTYESRGVARPAEVARPQLQPWMQNLKFQKFEL